MDDVMYFDAEEDEGIGIGEESEFTPRDKKNLDDNTKARHIHENKTVLDSITEEKVNMWDGYNKLIDNNSNSIANAFTFINNLAEQFSSFWECIQQKGTRTDYSYAFCNTDYEEIYPKYPITAEKVMYMFMGCSKLKDASNIVIDITAEKPNMMYVCANCNNMTAAPIFNFLNAPIIKTYTSMYTGCYSLISASVYWGDGSADAVTQRNACQNMFFKCWSLTDIDFGSEETGSPTGLDLSYAKGLTTASVQSLLTSLKTIPAGSAGKYEITLASETVEALTTEMLEGFTTKGWTILSQTRENTTESEE